MTMSGPPKGVDASDLWSKLATRERASTLVDYPGKDESPGQVRIRVLTVTEMQECRTAAEKEAKKMLGTETRAGDLGYEDIYRNEIVVQVICKACRQVEDTRAPAFPSAKLARDKLTEDDFAVLFEAYKSWKAEAGPIVSEMTEETLDAWLRVLQEGASRVPFSQLSSAALIDLILHLAARLPKSQTDSGSLGSPPEKSTSELRSDP